MFQQDTRAPTIGSKCGDYSGFDRTRQYCMWHVDATHNTLITAGNGGSETTTAEVTLFYNNGQSQYRVEKVLAPGQQLWLNVGDQIRNQIPDSDGHTIPPDTMTGSYELRDLDHALVGSLYEGKLVIDKTNGHAAYGCASCCGYYNTVMVPGLFSGPPNIDNSDIVQTEEQCTLIIDDVTSGAYGWNSSNTAIATLPSPTLHTVAVGSATGGAFIQLQGTNLRLGCPQVTDNPAQQVNVTPTISQNQKLWYFGNGISTPQGFTLGGTTATLTASGGGSGTYTWSITTGGSKAALQGTTSGQNVTSVQIASTSYSTSANDVTVQLQFTPSGGSAVTTSYSLSVDSPYQLVPLSITDQGLASTATCQTPTSGTSGYMSKIAYTARSFFMVNISNVPVNETFANIVDDYIGNNWPTYSPQAGEANYYGQFSDCILAIGPTATPPTLPPQSSVKIDHGSQALFVGSATEAAGVEVQSDTLKRYQDHGRHLSIVSPVR
jgi:hypothetical protein